MGIELSADSWLVMIAFGVYLLGVVALGIISHRFLTKGSFVKGYFLGNRALGPWVLALTVAATAISGGTFMGFPSLIYTNGWIMALWICSYMVVPIMTMALLGKRINQVARISGSVTVPDVLRDRFASPTLGILASLLILGFLCVNLVAQFKAGGLVMKEALLLRPTPATFVTAFVDRKEKVLRLYFMLPDRRIEEQKTPLPKEDAEFLSERTEVLEDKREVVVYFGDDAEPIAKRVKFPPPKAPLPVLGFRIDQGYLIGLLIFAFTVVAYTTYGGFWAVTWTDVLEGLVMLAGVILMAFLAMAAVPSIKVQEQPGGPQVEYHGLAAATERVKQTDPDLVYGPGPNNYLPLGMGFSFFLMWSVMGAGQPSGMVRLMSFKDSSSLKRALFLVSCYYIVTYVALLVIFVCARAIFPTEYLREIGTEGEPDSIMPAMTRKIAHPLAAGLLLAAPYAAIMSTVAAFLLMISSSLVRDLYQRTIDPNVSARTIKIISYTVTALVGVVVMLVALNPPGYLQYIIVFTGSGQGCSFLMPMLLGLYWRRATKAGMLAAMLGGLLTVLTLYGLGWLDSGTQAALRKHQESSAGSPPPVVSQWLNDNLDWVPGWGEKRLDAFAPIYLGGVDPLVWGLLASTGLGIGVSLLTRPDPKLVGRYFPASSPS